MASPNEKTPVQVAFFDKLKQALPASISIAADLADILEISADGAYRRMRGETVLSVDEMVKICRHYKIPPDILGGGDGTSTTFQHKSLENTEQGIEEYLKKILSDLKRINTAVPRQIIYAALDIPLFHQFYYPALTTFKLFFWQKAVQYLPAMEGKKFSSYHVKPEVLALTKQITETYSKIPSIEIWHDGTIISNLKLIEFAWDAGWFDKKEDALEVCKQFAEMISLIEKQAEKSSKFTKEEKWAENEGNFTMYHSDIYIGNNSILATAGPIKAVYFTYHTFNSMITTGTSFCNETEVWLKNLIRKSAPISGVGEKQRQRFFAKFQTNIQALKSKIEST